MTYIRKSEAEQAIADEDIAGLLKAMMRTNERLRLEIHGMAFKLFDEMHTLVKTIQKLYPEEPAQVLDNNASEE